MVKTKKYANWYYNTSIANKIDLRSICTLNLLKAGI